MFQKLFLEGLHSRYVERYLARLAELLRSSYLGTIVKGMERESGLCRMK